MQKLFKFAFFATALTVCVSPTSTAYSYEDTECAQNSKQVEDCTYSEVKTQNSNGYVQAEAPRKEYKRVSYSLAPRPEEFEMSDRQQLFNKEELQAREDRDGSIFGGRPCKSCSKNGSIFGGRPCKTCGKNGSIFGGRPCQGPNCQPRVEKTNPKYIQNYVVFDDDLYNSVHHECRELAPLQLEWVDFRIKKGMSSTGYSRKLGKYRFRIFGCRRNSKNAILNEGRILEKDMNFVEIFDDMVSDCYNIVKIPNDLCLRDDSPLPEYILTAEITDYYMNLCDEYNWDEAKNEDKRIGSSEMKVTWRLMDLNKTNVLWKGQSNGYGEVQDGEYNGEIVLIQRAFADAVNNLRNLYGFEDQLAQRVSAEEMQRQRQDLIDLQRQTDPVKCQFSKEIKIMEDSGVISSGYGMNEGWINVPETHKEIKVQEKSGQISGGSADNSSGQGAVNVGGTVPAVQMVDGKIVENSGIVTSGSGANESMNVSEIQMVDGKIVENSGVVASGSGANESGNITTAQVVNGQVIENSGAISDGSATSTYGSIAIGKVNAGVVEDGGQVSDGSAIITDGSMAIDKENAAVLENSGVITSGSGSNESGNVTTAQVINGKVVETSGVVSDGAGTDVNGQTAQGNNVIGENSGIASTGSTYYEVDAVEPMPSDMSAMFEKEKLCIKEQPDYDNMGPENVYKVRTAVVSVTNAKGKKGAGLLISEQFVMTSADLVDRKNNSYALQTINGKKLKARAFRINPKKNTALLVLEEPTAYTPLSLSLTLPAVEKDEFMTLGLFNFEDGNSEGYLETGGKVSGYRYDADGTSQIVIDTFVQSTTIGGVLIDEKGRIVGMAHTSRLGNAGPDLFLPIETAMKSLGVEICGKAFPITTPKPQKSWRQKAVAPLIESSAQNVSKTSETKNIQKVEVSEVKGGAVKTKKIQTSTVPLIEDPALKTPVSVKAKKTQKAVAPLIEKTNPKAPEAMKTDDRK